MNRIIAWLSLNGSLASATSLQACKFDTPHWQPDHHDIYIEHAVALSATQRFITPQCQAGLMPYQDNNTGCVINADVYLTNHKELCDLLGMDTQTSDGVLILYAYLKWGEDCTIYLKGNFCFVIWDPRAQHLFAAVDQFAHCPLFYFYQPEQFVMLANECSAFHTLYPHLTVNSQRFMELANDRYSATETAYQEIQKLPPGYQLVVTPKSLQKKRYWHWKDHRQKLAYKTREQYYIALQQNFELAVQKNLRRIGPLTTQISGGLDSSAVTAQAALLLAKEQQSLSAFTSIPNGLSGESYRLGWYYNELQRIETLLAQHSNIQHIIYQASPKTDILERLQPLQGYLDQPLRNINNFDWFMACYEYVLKQQGRVMLVGAGGNGSISWNGSSKLEILKSFGGMLKKKILRRPNRWIPNLHESMLSGQLTAPLRASVYALQLWYGVRQLDPTQELDLTVFCYNVPQWVYRTGKLAVEQRLLAREGLSNILPEAIAGNPYRGEQGADWYLHYNYHCQHWHQQLLELSNSAQAILWNSYDRQKIMAMFENYHHLNQPPDRKITHDLCYQLLRCLSVGLFLQSNLS